MFISCASPHRVCLVWGVGIEASHPFIEVLARKGHILGRFFRIRSLPKDARQGGFGDSRLNLPDHRIRSRFALGLHRPIPAIRQLADDGSELAVSGACNDTDMDRHRHFHPQFGEAGEQSLQLWVR